MAGAGGGLLDGCRLSLTRTGRPRLWPGAASAPQLGHALALQTGTTGGQLALRRLSGGGECPPPTLWPAALSDLGDRGGRPDAALSGPQHARVRLRAPRSTPIGALRRPLFLGQAAP